MEDSNTFMDSPELPPVIPNPQTDLPPIETTASISPHVQFPEASPGKNPRIPNSWRLPILTIMLLFLIGFVFALLIYPKINKTPSPKENTALPTPTGTSIISSNDLPTPPATFTWSECPSLKSWFLRPDGWHTFTKHENDIEACFISKESIETEGHYKTGLTVNFQTNVTSSVGEHPSSYALSYIHRAPILYKSGAVNEINAGNLKGYGREIESSASGQLITQYLLALGNDTADSLYIIYFDSPTESWETDWKIYGEPMIKNLVLDQ